MLSAPRRRVLAELQLILISPVLPSLTCIVETFMASLKVALNPSAKIVLVIIPSIYLILNGISISDLGQYEYLGKLELGKFKIASLNFW